MDKFKLLSTRLFVLLFAFLIFPNQYKAFSQVAGGDLDIYVTNGPGSDLTLKIQFKTTNTNPPDCDLEIYEFPGIFPDDLETCLIELESTECNGGMKGEIACSARAVLAIDTTSPRVVKYFKTFSTSTEGTCYPITQTQSTDLAFLRLGIIQSKSTGEICASDEPGLPGVTIYSDLNHNGRLNLDGRVKPIPGIASSNGTVQEDDTGKKRKYFEIESWSFGAN